MGILVEVRSRSDKSVMILTSVRMIAARVLVVKPTILSSYLSWSFCTAECLKLTHDHFHIIGNTLFRTPYRLSYWECRKLDHKQIRTLEFRCSVVICKWTAELLIACNEYKKMASTLLLENNCFKSKPVIIIIIIIIINMIEHVLKYT